MRPSSRAARCLTALRLGVVAAALAGAAAGAWAQHAAPPASELDAPLFYQLLIGEMRLAQGEAGSAYEVIMDAARRTRDEQLFRRAAQIALQSRQADQALSTARAWRVARPESLDALRLEVQVLMATDRSQEAIEPIRALVRKAPAAERAALVVALPRSFARGGTISRASAELLGQVLEPFAKEPALTTATRVAMGQSWLAAGDVDRAATLAEEAYRADPTAATPIYLALELMAQRPAAEQWVQEHLKLPQAEVATRLAYARTLMGAQRHADALRELDRVSSDKPDMPAPWLTKGALQLELHDLAGAEASLQRYLVVRAAEKGAKDAPAKPDAAASPTVAAPAGAASGAAVEAGGDDDDDEAPAAKERVSEPGPDDAYLLLSRVAEQRNDKVAAEAWLARIDDPRRMIEVQTRRATMLARDGKLDAARKAIRSAPERTAEDSRAKVMAEAGMLREVKRWADAYEVLGEAMQRFPEDADVLYEQSMLAEKLNRADESEQLLRRVIELKPDYAHAYNALGYSLADRGQRLPEARDLIAKALALTPGDPFITDSLGWVEFRLGNHAEALRLLKQAWSARPDPEIGAHLGEVLWTMERSDEAKAAWREALRLDGANETLRDTLARLKVRL